MSVIGRVSTAAAVERAALVTLKDYLPVYLADVAAQEGVKAGKIESVKSWAVSSEYEAFPETNLPAVIISSEGMVDEPRKDGAGFYTVTRSLEVSITIGAATPPRARLYAQIYIAAIAAALLQRRSLGDDMRATDWIDEANGTVSKTQRRTVVAAAAVFEVEHRNVVSWRKGKGIQPKQPAPAEATVQEIDVVTEVKE
jgi:hypothetical protein